MGTQVCIGVETHTIRVRHLAHAEIGETHHIIHDVWSYGREISRVGHGDCLAKGRCVRGKVDGRIHGGHAAVVGHDIGHGGGRSRGRKRVAELEAPEVIIVAPEFHHGHPPFRVITGVGQVRRKGMGHALPSPALRVLGHEIVEEFGAHHVCVWRHIAQHCLRVTG